MPMPEDMHPGWRELIARVQRQRTTSRRQFLTSSAGALAVLSCLPAGCGGGGSSGSGSGSSGQPDQADWPSNNPIKHVVVLCQENRSFDHYFGAFADSFGSGTNTALGFTPSALTYRNSAGTIYHPYHAVQFCEEDPDHTWGGSHNKWNLGAMDGWITDENGLTGSIGYIEAADHIYHVQLAQAFTLADRANRAEPAVSLVRDQRMGFPESHRHDRSSLQQSLLEWVTALAQVANDGGRARRREVAVEKLFSGRRLGSHHDRCLQSAHIFLPIPGRRLATRPGNRRLPRVRKRSGRGDSSRRLLDFPRSGRIRAPAGATGFGSTARRKGRRGSHGFERLELYRLVHHL